MGCRLTGPTNGATQQTKVPFKGSLSPRPACLVGPAGAYWWNDPNWFNDYVMAPYEKADLGTSIKSNSHEIGVFSAVEFVTMVKEAVAGATASPNAFWNSIREPLKTALDLNKTYGDLKEFASILKFFKDVGFENGFKAYRKVIKGKEYVVFKGYAGLRKIFDGTKYLANNTKVLFMSLGKIKNAKVLGGRVAFFFNAAYNVVDYLMRDEMLLSELIGGLAVDALKAWVSVSASIAAAGLVAGLSTVAIGPLIAAFAVGLAVGMALDEIDEQFKVTEKVSAGLEVIFAKIKTAKKLYDHSDEIALRAVNRYLDQVLDNLSDAAFKFVENEFKKFLNGILRQVPTIF